MIVFRVLKSRSDCNDWFFQVHKYRAIGMIDFWQKIKVEVIEMIDFQIVTNDCDCDD